MGLILLFIAINEKPNKLATLFTPPFELEFVYCVIELRLESLECDIQSERVSV